MKKIYLVGKNGDNRFVLVDNEDYEWLNSLRWFYLSGYAAHKVRYTDGTAATVLMHNYLANTPIGSWTDHKNGDRLDNRYDNLRVCTPQQNCWNRGMSKNNTSGFKGVSYFKDRGKWSAYIKINGKHKHIGTFDTALEAATAYDAKAIELYGDYARLNLHQ